MPVLFPMLQSQQDGFDCDAGLQNFKLGWSDAKMTWCCANQKKGCVQTEEPASGTVIEAPDDMACVKGPHAAQWGAVKHRLRALFNESSDPFAPALQGRLEIAVETSVAEIEKSGGWGKDAASECGFGKLFLQLLTISRIDEPALLAQYLQEHPDIASPVLTILLDIPWVVMAQTGWPFFAILRQLNHQKAQVVGPMLRYEEIDGLTEAPVKSYYDKLQEAQKNVDMPAAMQASIAYLQSKDISPGHPFAVFTALANQAAVQLDVKERFDLLKYMQDSMKQTISNAAELDVALTTRWPLWSYLHVGIDVFYDI